MFFVSFLCGAMLLSVYIYENVFFMLYSTLGNNGCIICAIEIKRGTKKENSTVRITKDVQ